MTPLCRCGHTRFHHTPRCEAWVDVGPESEDWRQCECVVWEEAW